MSGGGEILSKEGTTQSDPLGMAMFAFAIVLLILKLMEVCQMVYQVWFADDATAAASCKLLKQWWDALSTFGPHFGYSPNANKTILVVKDENK